MAPKNKKSSIGTKKVVNLQKKRAAKGKKERAPKAGGTRPSVAKKLFGSPAFKAKAVSKATPPVDGAKAEVEPAHLPGGGVEFPTWLHASWF